MNPGESGVCCMSLKKVAHAKIILFLAKESIYMLTSQLALKKQKQLSSV